MKTALMLRGRDTIYCQTIDSITDPGPRGFSCFFFFSRRGRAEKNQENPLGKGKAEYIQV